MPLAQSTILVAFLAELMLREAIPFLVKLASIAHGVMCLLNKVKLSTQAVLRASFHSTGHRTARNSNCCEKKEVGSFFCEGMSVMHLRGRSVLCNFLFTSDYIH
jgi:hypothetical protein